MSSQHPKYVIVSGGVVSGLGKGICASSIGMLLKSRGLHVTALKIDPYVNVDAGTMSPFEHGEVFVLDDGSETDLDLGNYERFLNIKLHSDNNLTTGKVYQEVINKERRGEYLGKTVQVVPHITDHIQEHIKRVGKIPVTEDGAIPDVCIIELGGTIGDIESLPFLEALAQFKQDLLPCDYCFVHVSLIPTVSGELKTKPTQHSVKSAKSYGLVPDVLCLRCDKAIDEQLQDKIRKTCHLPRETKIITNHNVASIYFVADLFHKQELDKFILTKFNMDHKNFPCDLTEYYKIINHFNPKTLMSETTVGIVGKYTGMQDTYLSLIRALEHASFKLKCKLSVQWIDAEVVEKTIETDIANIFQNCDCILIPGGFGNRGIEGMIKTAKFARETGIPLFGICLGMQVMLIEFARNIMQWDGANSTEFDPDTLYPVIRKSRKLVEEMGGTMRLGAYNIHIPRNSKTFQLFENQYLNDSNLNLNLNNNNSENLDGIGCIVTSERHRHRYEVKNKLFNRMMLKRNNLSVGIGGDNGEYDRNRVIEIIELNTSSLSTSSLNTFGHNNYWIGCQFHPELQTSISQPHWLFVEFLEAGKKRRN